MSPFDVTAWNSPDDRDDDDEEIPDDEVDFHITAPKGTDWSAHDEAPYRSFVEWLEDAKIRLNKIGGCLSMTLETAREYQIPLDVGGRAKIGNWNVTAVLMTESGRFVEGCE